MPERLPRYSILLLSASALAYEILLMRLFSIVQWHHFAYMVISLALLGYGVSGTFLSLTRSRLLPRFELAFVGNALLFGLSALVCFLVAQRLPFNTLEILWDRQQWLYLFLTYCLSAVPFFFAANSICLSFARYGHRIPLLYGYDMLGAGLGAAAIIGLLFLMSPLAALIAVTMVGLAAGVVAAFETGFVHRRRVALLALTLTGLVLLLPKPWTTLRISEFKELPQALLVPGTQVIEQRDGPLGSLSVIESPKVPLRYAPGLSFNNTQEPSEQLGVFTDGDGLGVISRFNGDKVSLAYLGYLTSALPYHLSHPSRMLVLGMGGGSELLQAHLQGVKQVDAVELDRNWYELLAESYPEFSGWDWLRRNIHVHIAEARGFVSASRDHYDLIQVSLMDSSSAATAGVHGLSENYVYTVEGLRTCLEHLSPDGLLSITRWIKLPPRDGLKIFATALDALTSARIPNASRHLIMIRGWKTSTLVVKHGEVTATDIAALRRFADERSFDLVYYPGMHAGEANRFNVLDEPYFYRGTQALAGSGREAFVSDYKFDVRPATDDKPYYFHFFKWASLNEVAGLFRQGGVALIELGYPVLIVTLLQAVVASVVLVLAPLVFLRQQQAAPSPYYAARVVAYFSLVGLAYLLVEIAFIQKFILFLSHPLYAVAVVLAGFLVFSGLGSRFAGTRPVMTVSAAVGLLAIIGLVYTWCLPPLFAHLVQLPDGAKVLVSLLLMAPLAFLMGMPFPMGLVKVSAAAPGLVPWAWGVNGCASLISAVLATVLAVHFGFTAVVMLALLLYLLAGFVGL